VKIAVCVKHVPEGTTHARIDPQTKRLDRSGEGAINPFDTHAVEEALRIKEAQGGEVLVVSMGPANAQDSVRKALAMGAASGVHVTDPKVAQTIAALLDESLPSEAVGERVERVAETEPTDGLEFDAQGNLYLTSLEWNAIKVLRPDGRIELVARSTDFQWPDTIAMRRDGDLLLSCAQFHLLPDFNGGEDKRTPPYKVFRLKLP
jgi:hypothetical protein